MDVNKRQRQRHDTRKACLPRDKPSIDRVYNQLVDERFSSAREMLFKNVSRSDRIGYIPSSDPASGLIEVV